MPALPSPVSRASMAAIVTTCPAERPVPHTPMRAASTPGSPWSQEIALRMEIKAGTVRSHKARIRRKLNVSHEERLGAFIAGPGSLDPV